jgi:hypothetical protein
MQLWVAMAMAMPMIRHGSGVSKHIQYIAGLGPRIGSVMDVQFSGEMPPVSRPKAAVFNAPKTKTKLHSSDRMLVGTYVQSSDKQTTDSDGSLEISKQNLNVKITETTTVQNHLLTVMNSEYKKWGSFGSEDLIFQSVSKSVARKTVSRFLDWCSECSAAGSSDTHGEQLKVKIWLLYLEWCFADDVQPMRPKVFGQAMNDACRRHGVRDLDRGRGGLEAALYMSAKRSGVGRPRAAYVTLPVPMVVRRAA